MPDTAASIHYSPQQAPDRRSWLAAPPRAREAAIGRWIETAELAWPRPDAGQWREVEDQLAAGYPPEPGRLLDRMLERGMPRTVAIWGLASVAGQRQFEQFNRMARRARSPRVVGLERLFDGRDFSILPAAFEAGKKGFGAAQDAVIEHYRRQYAPDRAMGVAMAAGFLFGHAAAPGAYRGAGDLEEALLGGRLSAETPVYLPVQHCYRALHEYVSESLFGELDPIPACCRPARRPEDCFDAALRDWCRGLIKALAERAGDWRAHLDAHPELRADRRRTVDALTQFAARPHPPELLARQAAGQSEAATEARLYAEFEVALQHLYRLAHPVLLASDTG